MNILLIGISGPSSSGKTTLSRLLRSVLHPRIPTFILHEDDFYKTDAEIPVRADGIQDWDCLGSIDLPALTSALTYIKSHGSSPPDLVSKEDQNSVGSVNVSETLVGALKSRSQEIPSKYAKVAIVDGFLLFSQSMKVIRELFDLRLFLHTDYATAKSRRGARKGYVTLEGFWEDPPGYVDKVVWPNYVADHGFLFQHGDVDGRVDADVCKELGLEVMPAEARGEMGECLAWAFDVIAKRLTE